MNKTGNTKYLLNKFKQGDLTSKEARELESIISTGDKHAELNEVLANLWEQSTGADIQAPSDRMLAKIRQHLSSSVELYKATFKHESLISRMIPAFKYAAVIICSMGISWFAKDYIIKDQGRTMAVSSNKNMYEIAVPYGSKSRISLPDGSRVNLNSGSTLRYPSDFSNTSRNVFLEGEAFFDVEEDSKNPFYVKTKELIIKVMGTEFNVKSYSDEDAIKTTLVSGSIEIYTNRGEISDKSRPLVLKPNQQAIFRKQVDDLSLNKQGGNQKDVRLINASKPISVQARIDVDPIIAWKDNQLVFKDENFLELSRKLERWFDVEINIQDKDLASVLFSGVFEQETIEQAMNALRLAAPFQFQINKNKITIKKIK